MKKDVLRLNFLWLLIGFLAINISSCSEDDPIVPLSDVTIETLSGKAEVVQDGTLVFKAKVENASEATFSWKMNDKEVGTDNTYKFVAKNLGKQKIFLEVTNSGGSKTSSFEFNVFGKYRDGIFILNEGNMTAENGSLIFINPQGVITASVYQKENKGGSLGNVSQDLFIADKKMYILSQNGRGDGMLIVVDAETLKKEESFREAEMLTADGKKLNNPTNLAVLDKENIFIRDNRGVYLFNSVSKEVTYIEGTKGADKNTMAVVNNRVFVPAKNNVLVFEANKLSIVQTIAMGDIVSGVLKSKDGNIWVSTTGNPNKISKIDSKTFGVIKANKITEGKLGRGWGSTPGITAKGDTLYYSNASTKIYRHIFSKAESTLIVDAKTMVNNANIVYNNIAVHPMTGKVYMNTLKGYGMDFLVNNISEFDFNGNKAVLTNNYKNYTHFPAGIFFTYNFQ